MISALRASILSFHSLQDSRLSPLEVTAFAGDCDLLCFILNYSPGEVFQKALKYHPKRRGGISEYDKGEGRVYAAMHTFLQKFVAVLLKVTTSHKDQSSP